MIQPSSEFWILTKSFRFEAAHMLPNHDGKCARLHGHSWVGEVHLESDTLHEEGPKQGMVTDYGDISRVMKPLLDDYLDHHFLNDTLELENPTSEEVSKWVYHRLKGKLPYLIGVTIRETCTSACTYREA